ncbi:MAG: type II toxin-antitoxin system RelE/ParE family toxin [Pirellulales bacterium]|nr:type II toxin-antitoxin system RelE/ParE family toxin [Pirellulales bacterium]
MVERAEKQLAEQGDWGTVEYVVLRNGHALAAEFISTLEQPNQAKLAMLFKRMADSGRIHNTQKFKKVDRDIYEFKSSQIRIGCFRVGRSWILTHGFIKKKNRWPQSELDRANNIRDEFMADN